MVGRFAPVSLFLVLSRLTWIPQKQSKKQSLLARLAFDETGQTATEYILLVVVVVISALGAFNLFNEGLVGYYQRITQVVSLPIP